MPTRAAVAALMMLLATTASASTSTLYLAQAQAGSADGSSCANAKAVSVFNTAANWGTGATQLGAGTTVHLCGAITTALTAHGNGTAGSPITMQWEPGASVQVCSTTAAVNLSGRSYLVLDLGGNTAAVTCPNNGTGLATTTIAAGITDGMGGGFSHVEIRNGTLGPIYRKSGASGDGLSTYGIYVLGGTGNRFHDLTFTDAEKGVFFALQGTSSGNELDHDTFVSCGAGIYYACGGSNCTDTGGQIHDNDFTVGLNWGNASDTTHMESLHVFTNGSGSAITGLLVYNNVTHGAWPAIGGTAALFVEQAQPGTGTQTGTFFNNVCILTGGQHAPGDGCIFIASGGNTFGLYNNVADCVSNSIGIGMELDASANNTFDVQNNVVRNCNSAIYAPGTGGTYTFDYNDYAQTGSGGWVFGSGTSTFASWKTKTGGDAHSSTQDPGLSADETIASATSFAIGAGTNLTAKGIAGLDATKPITVGAGSTVTGQTRPSSGAWNVGPYAYGAPPNPPTNLAAVVH